MTRVATKAIPALGRLLRSGRKQLGPTVEAAKKASSQKAKEGLTGRQKALLGGLAAADLAALAGPPLGRSIASEFGAGFEEELESYRDLNAARARLNARDKAAAQDRARAIQSLAMYAPKALNELAAGEALAEGEVTIGGRARMDLIMEAIEQMPRVGMGMEPLPSSV